MEEFWIDFSVLEGQGTDGNYFVQSCQIEDGLYNINYIRIDEDGTSSTIEEQHEINKANMMAMKRAYNISLLFIIGKKNEKLYSEINSLSDDIEYFKSRKFMADVSSVIGLLAAPTIGYSIANYNDNKALYFAAILVGTLVAINGLRSKKNSINFNNKIEEFSEKLRNTINEEYTRLRKKTQEE